MKTELGISPFGSPEYTIDMPFDMPPEEFDIDAANELLAEISPVERIRWGIETFGDDLYAMTSAGAKAAMIPELISQSGHRIPFIFIDTGDHFPETFEFKDELVTRYDLELYVFRPTQAELDNVVAKNLAKTDVEEYGKITKLKPLTQAVESLGIKALLSGVLSYETDVRATLRIVDIGNDGEVRINPFLDWTAEQVDEYFTEHELPRNALYHKGYGSIGDMNLTTPGIDRTGRALPKTECGLQVLKDGRAIRSSK